MSINEFLTPPAESARREGPYHRIVLSSRVRLARNLKGGLIAVGSLNLGGGKEGGCNRICDLIFNKVRASSSPEAVVWTSVVAPAGEILYKIEKIE